METAQAVESLSESYPAVAHAVPRARRALSAFAASAGVTGERLERVCLAASEAVSNAVLHAYAGRPGEIHITAAVVSGELWILIADDGCGLRAAPRDSGGLGLGLRWMATFSDGLTLVRRSSGGLEVHLRFKLPGMTSAADEVDQLPARVASFC